MSSFQPTHSFHCTPRRDSLIATAGITVAATAYGAKIIVNAWNAHQKEKAEREPPQTPRHDSTSTAESASSSGASAGERSSSEEDTHKTQQKTFDQQIDEWWEKLSKMEFKMPSMPSPEGMRYYAGGFEDKMTRREAAQILGIRESADAKRIKAAHRKILIANHPDKGGSPYMATKINEAKEMLIKGKV